MGPLQSSTSVLTITRTTSAEVSAKQFIGFDGAPAGDGAAVLGVTQTDAAANREVAVDVIAVVDLVAGAAIAAGADVQSDANGQPIAKVAGIKVGTALNAAINPGDIVTILIK